MSETIFKLNIPVGIHKALLDEDTEYIDQCAKIKEEAEEINLAIYDIWQQGETVGTIDHLAEECCDCITACVGMMFLLNYSKNDIEDMMRKVLTKNRERGYLEWQI